MRTGWLIFLTGVAFNVILIPCRYIPQISRYIRFYDSSHSSANCWLIIAASCVHVYIVNSLQLQNSQLQLILCVSTIRLNLKRLSSCPPCSWECSECSTTPFTSLWQRISTINIHPECIVTYFFLTRCLNPELCNDFVSISSRFHVTLQLSTKEKGLRCKIYFISHRKTLAIFLANMWSTLV